MIALLALWGLLGGPALAHGNVYHYSLGTFASVARVRHMALSPAVDGYASTPNCALVNAAAPRLVYARIGAGPVLRLQIVDCSAPRDRAAQARKGLVLEVDYATARRAGFAWPPGAGHAPGRILGYGRISP